MTQTDGGVRDRDQRRRDALAKLERDIDVWVGTASADGVPTLVPLTFWWDGRAVWLSTVTGNPTGVNLRESGAARLCFGTTRDVVHIEGTVRAYTAEELPEGVGDSFAAKDGWDPRTDPVLRYDFYEVRPEAVRVWGPVAETRGRLIMRDGKWLP